MGVEGRLVERRKAERIGWRARERERRKGGWLGWERENQRGRGWGVKKEGTEERERERGEKRTCHDHYDGDCWTRKKKKKERRVRISNEGLYAKKEGRKKKKAHHAIPH